MHECAILFAYFGGAPRPVLEQNLGRLRRLNPDTPIIPLCHDGAPTIDGTVDLGRAPCPWNTANKWRSCDTMIYRWFPDRAIRARRYVLCEWDTYATTSLREFYAPVWDADVAAVEAFTRDERPDWWFFNEVALLGELAPAAAGLVPFSGTLFSAAALEAICRGPVLTDAFCELRVATLAHHAGLTLTSMPFARGYISFAPQYIRLSEAPGVYHPVKHLVTEPPSARRRPDSGEADGARAAELRRFVTNAAITTRTDVINLLIWIFGLERYLEIGVGEPWHNFERVAAPVRHGVDPAGAPTFTMPSDQFFAAGVGCDRYDIAFIDGLHDSAQCLRDIENALARLAPGGFIVVHDANPPSEWHQRPPEDYVPGSVWNGTVWRSIVAFRQRHPELPVHTVDVDWGCAVIRAPPRGPWPAPVPLGEIDAAGGFAYADFERHRAGWLDLIATEDFRAILLDAMSAGELSA